MPFGSFDTPLNAATGITGSIAVTGWAMDDVEVTRVKVMRDPVAGEPGGALVFVGDAVLVDGARPDVQAFFPNLPRNSRAGCETWESLPARLSMWTRCGSLPP